MNVTAVVDTSGNVVERFEYTPYGQVTELDPDFTSYTGSDYDIQVLFAGYRHDPDVGFYHVRHRVYHPTLGRWLTRDPAGYRDGMNLHEYVQGQPTAFVDAYGLHIIFPHREPFQFPQQEPRPRTPEEMKEKRRQEMEERLPLHLKHLVAPHPAPFQRLPVRGVPPFYFWVNRQIAEQYVPTKRREMYYYDRLVEPVSLEQAGKKEGCKCLVVLQAYTWYRHEYTLQVQLIQTPVLVKPGVPLPPVFRVVRPVGRGRTDWDYHEWRVSNPAKFMAARGVYRAKLQTPLEILAGEPEELICRVGIVNHNVYYYDNPPKWRIYRNKRP